MAFFKLNKPDTFNGKRDEFTNRTSIYQVRQYLELLQVGNDLNLDDPQKSLPLRHFYPVQQQLVSIQELDQIMFQIRGMNLKRLCSKNLFLLIVCKGLETNCTDSCSEIMPPLVHLSFVTLFDHSKNE